MTKHRPILDLAFVSYLFSNWRNVSLGCLNGRSWVVCWHLCRRKDQSWDLTGGHYRTNPTIHHFLVKFLRFNIYIYIHSFALFEALEGSWCFPFEVSAYPQGQTVTVVLGRAYRLQIDVTLLVSWASSMEETVLWYKLIIHAYLIFYLSIYLSIHPSIHKMAQSYTSREVVHPICRFFKDTS